MWVSSTKDHFLLSKCPKTSDSATWKTTNLVFAPRNRHCGCLPFVVWAVFRQRMITGLSVAPSQMAFALLPPFLGSQRGFVSWARPHWHNRSLLLLITLVICPVLLTSPSRWLVLCSSGPLWWVVTAGVGAKKEVPVKGF